MNLLEKMKKRNISTLEVHRVLADNNIHVSKRTLHDHLENNVIEERNPIAARVVDYLVNQYDKTRLNVKKILQEMDA